MRLISVSLLVTVLGATIGLGALLSWGYQQLSAESSPTNSLDYYRSFSVDLAHALGQSHEPEVFIQHWNMRSDITLAIDTLDSIVLPESLSLQLDQGLPVALESEQAITLYIQLANRHSLLLLTLPSTMKEAHPLLELLLTMIFYSGVIVAIGLWLLPLLARLRRLDQAAAAIADGRLNARIAVSKTSYIQRIENTFNEMAEKIEQLIADNKLLSRAVSHDLKTPLARLRFGVDMLEEEHELAVRQQYYQRINRDLDHMESLINTLLDYAKLEEVKLSIQKTPIDLGVLVQEALEHFDGSALVSLQRDIKSGVMINADRRYLGMLIHNLVLNAMQHAKSRVQVSLSASANAIIFRVVDDGDGISPSHSERIFQPFQRGDGAKSHGHGMGLAICDRIAGWFAAEISVGRSQTLGGAEFTVTFVQGSTS